MGREDPSPQPKIGNTLDVASMESSHHSIDGLMPHKEPQTSSGVNVSSGIRYSDMLL
jgi:hypothetical protein